MTTNEDMKTGYTVRISRGGLEVEADITALSDPELSAFFARQDEKACRFWAMMLARWVRDWVRIPAPHEPD